MLTDYENVVNWMEACSDSNERVPENMQMFVSYATFTKQILRAPVDVEPVA